MHKIILHIAWFSGSDVQTMRHEVLVHGVPKVLSELQVKCRVVEL